MNREIRQIREQDFFRVVRVVRGKKWDGQPAATGAISGA
jgi:hypothetical protein